MKLQIKDDAGRVTVVSIANRNEITIGRREGHTIRLTERNVSRNHARLVKSGDEVTLEDLSRYGTRVNGQRVRGSRQVGTGDIIHIGDYELSLDGARQVVPPAAPEHRAPELRGPPTEADLKRQREIAAAARAQIAAAKADGLGAKREATTSVQALGDGPDGERGGLGAGQKRFGGALPSLVVVSDELAGKSWSLNEGTTIVGRSGECGLVIDHHSVSGNHARLSVTASETKILDLKSKNGVRINGERWEESTLKTGDLVELGKVKLRFVEPGEVFVYNPEAWRNGVPVPAAVPAAGGPARRGRGLWLGIGALVLVGGAAAWSLTRPKPTSNTPNPAPVTAATPAGTGKAAPVPAPSAVGRQGGGAAKVEAERDKAEPEAPQQEGTSQQDEATKRDEAVANTLKLAEQAKADGDAMSAWAQLSELGEAADSSAHAARLASLRRELKPEVVAGYLAEAQALFADKRYPEAIQKAEQLLALEAEHPEATKLLAKAKAKADKDKDKADKADKDKPGDATRSADEIYKEAKSFHNSDPAKALALYREAADKGRAEAWRHIGSLKAKAGDRAGATKAYETFLQRAPDAKDAETVREMLRQWQGR